MIFIFPAACLKSIVTKVLESAPLDLISLESPSKVVSDAATGLHHYIVAAM